MFLKTEFAFLKKNIAHEQIWFDLLWVEAVSLLILVLYGSVRAMSLSFFSVPAIHPAIAMDK